MITSLALCHSTARRRAPYNIGDILTHLTALSDENQTMSNKYPEGPAVSLKKTNQIRRVNGGFHDNLLVQDNNTHQLLEGDP